MFLQEQLKGFIIIGGGLRKGGQRQCRGGVQWRGPYHYEVALPRPAAPQRLRLPALQLQVRLASPEFEEIAAAYMRLYGKESRDLDNESDGSDKTGGLGKEDGEQDVEGGGEEA